MKFQLLLYMILLCTALSGQNNLFLKDLKTYPLNSNWYVKDMARDKLNNTWFLSANDVIRYNRFGPQYYKEKLGDSLSEANYIAVTDDLILYVFYKNRYTELNLVSNKVKRSSYPLVIDSMIHDEKSIYIKSGDVYYNFFTQKKVAVSEITPPPHLYNPTNLYTTTGGLFKDVVDRVFYKNGKMYISTNFSWFEMETLINNKIIYHTSKTVPDVMSRSIFPIAKDYLIQSFDMPGELYLYKNGQYMNLLNLPINGNKYLSKNTVYHIGWLDSKHLLLLDEKSVVYILDLNNYKIKPYETLNNLKVSFKNLCNTRDSAICIGSYNGDFVVHYYKTNITIVKRATPENKLNDIFRLYEDPSGLLWIGMGKSLAVYNPKNDYLYNDLGFESSASKNEISAIAVDNENRLWLGNYGSYIGFFDYNDAVKKISNKETAIFKNAKFTNFNKEYGFPSFNIKFINVFGQKLYVRTNDGLSIINAKTLTYSLITPNNGFGRPLNNQMNYIVDSSYYSAVESGYLTIDFNKNLTSRTPTIFFNEINFSNKIREDNYAYSLSKNFTTTTSNAFIILKIGDFFNTGVEDRYEYKIDNGQWIVAEENKIVISTIKQGNYKVAVRNKGTSAYTNTEAEVIITVIVTAPWYKSNLFYTIIGFLAMSLVYYLYRLNQKVDLQKQKARQFELTSLKNQMNPHFISNSLNSINLYVLQNKSEEASDYIVRFSKLIRSILANSEHEFIALETEMEMLINYIEMEKLRFKNKFEYVVEYNGNVDMQYNVPSLVLQPFVENAIWHGLLQSKVAGKLLISITGFENGIEVKIDDNGIGRIASKALHSKNTVKRKSFGMEIVKKRFELIYQQYKKKCTYTVIDKVEPNSGTTVIIKF